MSQTSIQWTDRVWNPTTGCDQISPGCAHCYAKTIAGRFWKKQYPPVLSDGCAIKTRAREFEDVQVHPDRLDQPLRWTKPARIFVNSMSDLFHEDVPDAFIDQVFAVMIEARRHTFQVLTKRADRMLEYFTRVGQLALDVPAPNVWLGVSVENQHFADERIPLLLQTPAAVRFISAEPLLGPVCLDRCAPYVLDGDESNPGILNAFNGTSWHPATVMVQPSAEATRDGIQWVIVGGESGPGARRCETSWIRNIVGQCREAGVSVFVKQLGRVVGGQVGVDFRTEVNASGFPEHDTRPSVGGRLIFSNTKGGDIDEWPEDLRVREFPA